MLNMFCVAVIFMMQKLDGTVQPYTNEDDDQFPKIVVVGCASTRESCSNAHTNIHNDILVSSQD